MINGTTQKVTKIGFANASIASGQAIPNGGANPGLKSAEGALIVYSDGIAAVLTGAAGASGGGFTLNGSVGVVINTTARAINDTVRVGSTDIVITAPKPATGTTVYFAFVVKNLDFNFKDLVEIRGDFPIGNDGSFHGTNLEVFVGKGPSRLNGQDNPDAIGILINNATIDFQRFEHDRVGHYACTSPARWPCSASTACRSAATWTSRSTPRTVDCTPSGRGTDAVVSVAAQTFGLLVTNLHLGVAGVLDIGGTLVVTRQPNGTLDLAIGERQRPGRHRRHGRRPARRATPPSRSRPATGFRLAASRSPRFTPVPETPAVRRPPPRWPPRPTPRPVLFPTADLAARSTAGHRAPLDLLNADRHAAAAPARVVFNDLNGVGLRPDEHHRRGRRVRGLVNGVKVTGITLGAPDRWSPARSTPGTTTSPAGRLPTPASSRSGSSPAASPTTPASAAWPRPSSSTWCAAERRQARPGRGPRQPDQRRDPHRRGPQRPPLHRRHLHQPRRHADQQGLDRGRRRRSSAQRHRHRDVHASTPPAPRSSSGCRC